MDDLVKARMTPEERLRNHHEKLVSTIQSLADRARNNPADSSLFICWCRENLIPHMEAEEATFYAASGHDEVAGNLAREHKEIKLSLDVIDYAFIHTRMESIAMVITDFMNLLEQHRKREDDALIPELQAKLSQGGIQSLIEESLSIEAGKRISDVRSLLEYDHMRINLNISALHGAEGDRAVARNLYSVVRAQLLKHIDLEERFVFPAFDERYGTDNENYINSLLAEHVQIASCISVPPSQLDSATFSNVLRRLTVMVAAHRKDEEAILYPLINRKFRREIREKLYEECFQELLLV